MAASGDLLTTSNSTFRLTSGINGSLSPKIYTSGWNGGSRARITTYRFSTLGRATSTGAGMFTTGLSYYQIANGTASPITYADAGVGTLGLMASGASYFYGVQIPAVGQGVAIYGGLRLTWDVFYNLGARYGPSKWFGNDDSKWFK